MANIEIVIVEDEGDILELLEYHLHKEGYSVTGFLSPLHVEQFIEEENPALLIIDRNLPNIEGSQFVFELREKGYDIPVIFLSAKDAQEEIEEGLERGGDDYITKPFSPKELLLRVNSLLKRSGKIVTQNRIKYKDITLEPYSKSVIIDEQKITLTNLEFDILRYFMTNTSTVIPREILYELFWHENEKTPNYNAINVAITRLKKKLGSDGASYIKSVWGSGYKFE